MYRFYVPAKPSSRVIVNKLTLVNPITKEKFGDPITIVCEVTKTPKSKKKEPEPIVEEGDDEKSRILDDIQIGSIKCINMIDNLMNDIESSGSDEDELSDIDREGSDVDKSEF